MSLKWTGSNSESGILRKSEQKEKKEELFVFGYSCKLFREDDKAQHIDQGKHLIPWMGDETLKIDRYDARGALHDLSTLEAPSGGYDWRVELTKAELDVEQLCDDERYRALHTDEDEEEMYKEEELKRLHAAGYGQVGFNYDAPAEPSPVTQPVEIDEPFVPTPELKALLPSNVVFPETQKQNAIIEKTAKFIASQGAQMEILIKAKQGDNLQFQFLNKDSTLHPYYSALTGLVKSGKWPETKPEIIEEKPHENEEYLHPSLASTIIESAPSIPSIHYKPSADCDYTMLISKMRGEATLDEVYPPELAPGEVPPPGTEPLPPRSKQISRPPVLYNLGHDTATKPTPASNYQQYAAYYHHYTAQPVPQQLPVKPQAKPIKKPPQPPTSLKSTGLSLMKNYNTDSDSDASDIDDASSTDSKDKPAIVTPPEDVQLVIDKMAAYVARNGDEFADIVRSKNDPRFTFLDHDHMFYPYYKRLMQQKRGINVNGKKKARDDNEKWNVPVSFSIKKLKEADPILPKPALPYETSSDEDLEKHGEKQEEKQVEKQQNNILEIEIVEKTLQEQEEIEPQPVMQQTYDLNNTPPVIVYKMEGQLTSDLPLISAVAPLNNVISKSIPPANIPEVTESPKPELVSVQPENPAPKPTDVANEKEPKREVRKEEKVRDSSPNHRREKTKRRDKRKEYTSKSESRERRVDRTPDREKRREKESDRERKRLRYTKEEVETEIISLVDNSDELIDLTGEQSDSRGEGDVETDRVKQHQRRRRAAEFLKKVGVDPAAATLPTTSLASAMVDTLELLRRKKLEEEEKRRRREKRRHRDRREDDYHRKSRRRRHRSSDDEDDESSKKKKRKKDKKHSSKSKKKRRKDEDTDEGNDVNPLNIDLTSTLKELRSRSPTKDLVLQDIDQNSQHSFRQDSSEEENDRETGREKRQRVKRADRQYSEGEWSSNSEDDSRSSRDIV